MQTSDDVLPSDYASETLPSNRASQADSMLPSDSADNILPSQRTQFDLSTNPDIGRAAASVDPYFAIKSAASQSTLGQPTPDPYGDAPTTMIGQILNPSPDSEQLQQMASMQKARDSLGVERSSNLAKQISEKWDSIISMARESRPENVAMFEKSKEDELASVGFDTIKLFGAPEFPKTTPEDIQALTGFKGRTAENFSRAQNAVSGIAESFLSPEGIAMAAGPESVAKPLAAAFTGQMATHAPASLSQAAGYYSAGDKEKGDEALVSGMVEAGMLAVPLALSRIKSAELPSDKPSIGLNVGDALEEALKRKNDNLGVWKENAVQPENPVLNTKPTPDDVLNMSDAEWDKLNFNRDEFGNRTFKMGENAIRWALSQGFENAPELIKKLERLRDIQAQRQRESSNPMDRTQWFSDAIHILKADAVGIMNARDAGVDLSSRRDWLEAKPEAAETPPAVADVTPSKSAGIEDATTLLASPAGDVTRAMPTVKNEATLPNDSKTVGETPGSGNESKGWISGSDLETWADRKIAETKVRVMSGLDPEQLSAYVIKGAALIERGVRKAADWTKQMMADHGLNREQALRVWISSKRLLDKGRQTDVRRIVEMTTGIDPESFTKEMSQKDVAGIQEKASSQGFKAGQKAGAESVANEPENITLKQRIGQSAEIQAPIADTRTKAQALREMLSNSIARDAALREYYAGQEKASSQGAAATRRDVAIADKWLSADTERVRQSLLELVKTLPLSERGKFTQSITAAMKRPSILSSDTSVMYERAATVAAKIMNRVEEVHRDSVVSEVQSLFKKAQDSPSVDVNFKSRMGQLLNRFSLRGSTADKLASLKATRDYIIRMKSEGKETAVPEEILKQMEVLAKTPLKDLPVDVLENLRDQMRALYKQGKLMTATRAELWNNKKTRALSELPSEVTAPIEKRAELIPQPGDKSTFGMRLSNKLRTIFNFGDHVGTALQPIDALLDYLGDSKAQFNGWLFRHMRFPLDNAFNRFFIRQSESLIGLNKIITEEKLTDKHGERIGVTLISRMKGGKQRLIAGGVDPQIINKILNEGLSLGEQRAAAYISSRMNRNFPEIQQLMRELYNIAVPEVKDYFPYQREFGSYKDWTDSYNDVKPETNPVTGEEIPMHELVARKWLESSEFKTTRSEQGFTVERVPDASTRVKTNAFDVFRKHETDVAYLLEMQRDLKLAGELMRTDEFIEKYGDVGQRLVKDWLDTVARQGMSNSSQRIFLLDQMRKASSYGLVAFRLGSSLVHASNSAMVVSKIGAVWYARGLKAAMTPEGRSFLQANFAETQARSGGEIGQSELKQGVLAKAGFLIPRVIDRVQAEGAVLGSYLRSLSEGGQSWKEFSQLPVDSDAINTARTISRRAVASPLPKDLPLAISQGALTKGNVSLGRSVFQFGNIFLDQYSNIKLELYRAGIKNLDPELAAKTLIGMGIVVALETGIKNESQDLIDWIFNRKQKTETPKTLVKTVAGIAGKDAASAIKDHPIAAEAIVHAMHKIPFAGNVFQGVMYGESGIPVIDEMVGIEKTAGDYFRATNPETKQRKIAQLAGHIGAASGVPIVGQVSDELAKKPVSETPPVRQRR